MKHLFFHEAVISLLAPGIASADADKIKAVENGALPANSDAIVVDKLPGLQQSG